MKDKMKRFNVSLKRAPEDKEIEEGQQSKKMAEVFFSIDEKNESLDLEAQ